MTESGKRGRMSYKSPQVEETCLDSQEIICASDPYNYSQNPSMGWGDGGEQSF